MSVARLITQNTALLDKLVTKTVKRISMGANWCPSSAVLAATFATTLVLYVVFSNIPDAELRPVSKAMHVSVMNSLYDGYSYGVIDSHQGDTQHHASFRETNANTGFNDGNTAIAETYNAYGLTDSQMMALASGDSHSLDDLAEQITATPNLYHDIINYYYSYHANESEKQHVLYLVGLLDSNLTKPFIEALFLSEQPAEIDAAYRLAIGTNLFSKDESLFNQLLERVQTDDNPELGYLFLDVISERQYPKANQAHFAPLIHEHLLLLSKHNDNEVRAETLTLRLTLAESSEDITEFRAIINNALLDRSFDVRRVLFNSIDSDFMIDNNLLNNTMLANLDSLVDGNYIDISHNEREIIRDLQTLFQASELALH